MSPTPHLIRRNQSVMVHGSGLKAQDLGRTPRSQASKGIITHLGGGVTQGKWRRERWVAPSPVSTDTDPRSPNTICTYNHAPVSPYKTVSRVFIYLCILKISPKACGSRHLKPQWKYHVRH